MSPRAWTAFVAVSVPWGVPDLLIEAAVGDGVAVLGDVPLATRVREARA